MSHQKRVLRYIRSDVAPPVTSPPVYRGDIDARGTAQDLVPRSLWVDFWDTLFFIFAGIASLVLTFMILANTVTILSGVSPLPSFSGRSPRT